MKIINQAYDVLSDSLKREKYNQELEYEQQKEQTISQEERDRIMQENYVLKQQINKMNNNFTNKNNRQLDEGTIINMSRILEQQIRNAQERAYHDAYVEDMRSRGYKIKYKHDMKYYLKLLLIIVITIFVFFLIYQIPVVKKFFTNLYNENIIFQAIVNVFKNTFSKTL